MHGNWHAPSRTRGCRPTAEVSISVSATAAANPRHRPRTELLARAPAPKTLLPPWNCCTGRPVRAASICASRRREDDDRIATRRTRLEHGTRNDTHGDYGKGIDSRRLRPVPAATGAPTAATVPAGHNEPQPPTHKPVTT